jgi:hypothetical protein
MSSPMIESATIISYEYIALIHKLGFNDGRMSERRGCYWHQKFVTRRELYKISIIEFANTIFQDYIAPIHKFDSNDGRMTERRGHHRH